MAKQGSYSSPNVATYQKVRLPLVGEFTNRLGSISNKDQRYINCIPEMLESKITGEKNVHLIKRAGLSLINRPPGVNAEGRGIYYFNGALWSVFGNTLYKGIVNKQTLTTSSGRVGFVEGNTGSGTRYLFLCDGNKGYQIKTDDSVTVIVDVDFPNPHIPIPEFMDGYIFVIAANSEDIYNSDLDNPLSWQASNFIQMEAFGDLAVGLTRQNNQLVGFGTDSIEFFFDAANVTGSPLGSTSAAVIQMGCAAPYAVCQNEKAFWYIGQSSTGGRAVWQTDGFQPKRISDDSIEKILDQEGSNIINAIGFMVRTQGHFLYCINLTNRTIVYDTDEKFWHEWSSNDGSDNHSKFRCSATADDGSGQVFLQDDSNGNIYKLSTTIYQDNNSSIIVEGITDKFDFGTVNRKFFYLITFVGDTTTSTSNFTFRWTDDDYQTWSNWKTLDLNQRPFFPKLGVSRRRAFNFRYLDNFPLRLEGIEVEYNQGNT